MPDSSSPLHLAVALDGAGWHPAAWRAQDARPAELFGPGYWSDLVAEAERGSLDFVTIEDSLGLQSDDSAEPDDQTDRVRGRLDAVLIASRIAPRTRGIGFLPTAVVTHTEPFHVSKSIATLDYVSTGRAGVRIQISGRRDVAAHFGRRASQADDYFAEAADYVEVLRRLWDSWEDDAEIRDVATGRFVDRNKLHYIDFEGRWFSVKGPSITPRPPQGQPVVAALGHGGASYDLIAGSVDVGFVTPHSAAQAADLVGEIRALQWAAGRRRDTVHLFGDLVVFLDHTPQAAQARRQRFADLAGSEYQSDAEIFTGTPVQLGGPAAGVAGARAVGISPAPSRASPRPGSDHRGPGAGVASPQAVSRRVRGRHAARSVRTGPARQPLRDRLNCTFVNTKDVSNEQPAQADPSRRALSWRQQHHGVE